MWCPWVFRWWEFQTSSPLLLSGRTRKSGCVSNTSLLSFQRLKIWLTKLIEETKALKTYPNTSFLKDDKLNATFFLLWVARIGKKSQCGQIFIASALAALFLFITLFHGWEYEDLSCAKRSFSENVKLLRTCCSCDAACSTDEETQRSLTSKSKTCNAAFWGFLTKVSAACNTSTKQEEKVKFKRINYN